MTTILMGNLGYLRGINGCLSHHVRYASRHIYCPRPIQEIYLKQLIHIIEREKPDICCFVEIDRGSDSLKGFNQLEALVSERYPFFDIENKYGPVSRLRELPFLRGKSNGFVANRRFTYHKTYFTHGTKRLIYQIHLEPHLTLFFAHFSLKKTVRALQLLQVRHLLQATPGDSILLGDFNIHGGFSELAPLMQENNLVLLNRADQSTFRFHTMQLPLDLCICSRRVAERAELTIIPQPYSDHEALLLKIDP